MSLLNAGDIDKVPKDLIYRAYRIVSFDYKNPGNSCIISSLPRYRLGTS